LKAKRKKVEVVKIDLVTKKNEIKVLRVKLDKKQEKIKHLNEKLIALEKHTDQISAINNALNRSNIKRINGELENVKSEVA
jgi:chromosome segregation ATPase